MIITLIVLVVYLVAHYGAATLSESSRRLNQLRREFKPCAPVKFCDLYTTMIDAESNASEFRQR